MNKTTILTGIVIVGCIATLIFSYLVYESRIEDVSSQTTNAPEKTTKQQETSSSDKEKPAKDSEEVQEVDSLSKQQITSLTANMSDDVSEVVTSRLETEEKIQLLVIGSSSIEQGSPGYGELLSTNLTQAYGDWIETTTLSYDKTTASLVDDLDGILIDWSQDYDVVLLEGMNLSNNGEVVVEEAIGHIETINKKMQQSVSDSVLVVHPSQPLASATHYPTQVDSFKSYLTSREFTYIDHWSEWPVGNEDEMNTYLTEDSIPNVKGAALWASALSTFFTGK
ncbi:SGNH/GDSL hydrolase family protein [Paenisporosarcina antarctica]|uniref:SGNH/GDSL hydrolase family protein n=1 Tax=Paenisporosarcina antarctica TaxID=417367 RepID=A0A4V1AN98_9BACL|nr:SGNH/GDSL hydrolase family protein [Paenisporosarcina antarctica]QBP42025.1 SGNH/GDSL hydrolase family protein [Paenisporosarcina antarctica]